jgi:hypothetical protein
MNQYYAYVTCTISVLSRCANLVKKYNLVATQSVKTKVSDEDSGYSAIRQSLKMKESRSFKMPGKANSATKHYASDDLNTQ